jgi:hypothetical protein
MQKSINPSSPSPSFVDGFFCNFFFEHSSTHYIGGMAMARIWVLAISIWITFSASGFAAMDPKEIEEIKQAAPLHLKGEVVEDRLIKEIDFPGQERVMSIQVAEVSKGDQLVKSGATIEVYYTYIPEWLQVEGGSKMDIAVADRLEIWLETEGGGWKPAASGDTVTHLFKSKERPEHMARPFSEAVSGFWTEMPLLGIVSLILGTVLVLAAFVSAKFAPSRR